MNHAIVNPPVDRAKAADQVKDVFITIQKETDAGIYVSGAKVVATSSALTHYNFLGQNAAVPTHDTDLAVMFIAPMNAPGREADLPRLLRDDGERDGHAVRLSAVVALRRERRDLRVRQRFHPVGGRAAPPRPREAQDLLSAVGLSRRLPVPGLHAARGQARFSGRASSPRRCARRAPTSSAAIRRCSARSSPGAICSGR